MSNRRFEVFEYRQVLVRMRQGDSDRDIAGAHLMGRGKLKTVRQVALAHGWLDPGGPLPDDAELAGIFGRDPKVPRSRISTLEPFRDLVRGWFDADVGSGANSRYGRDILLYKGYLIRQTGRPSRQRAQRYL
jgi:hypothetical protein